MWRHESKRLLCQKCGLCKAKRKKNSQKLHKLIKHLTLYICISGLIDPHFHKFSQPFPTKQQLPLSYQSTQTRTRTPLPNFLLGSITMWCFLFARKRWNLEGFVWNSRVCGSRSDQLWSHQLPHWHVEHRSHLLHPVSTKKLRRWTFALV